MSNSIAKVVKAGIHLLINTVYGTNSILVYLTNILLNIISPTLVLLFCKELSFVSEYSMKGSLLLACISFHETLSVPLFNKMKFTLSRIALQEWNL